MSSLIKAKPKSTLIKEGVYQATVTAVSLKPNDAAPKKVSLEFTIDGMNRSIIKEVPASFDEDSSLRRDPETLLDRGFKNHEAEAGFDPIILIGKRATITVGHRGGKGGKLTEFVTIIQPPASVPPVTDGAALNATPIS